MNTNKSDFLSILIDNNAEKICDFLNRNGKKAKPISPVFFLVDKEEQETN